MNKQKALALICWGFLFLVSLASCKHMPDDYLVYPFRVYRMPPHQMGEQDYGRNYQIWVVDKQGLNSVGTNEYGDLFDKYGFTGNGESWREHIQFIIEEKNSLLLDNLQFDCNSDEFLVWADSEETVQRFLEVVMPVFESEAKLEAHFKQLDPEDFME